MSTAFGVGDASYQAAGGRAGLAALVERFYQYMDTLDDASFQWYADACAATLARAHGQSPDASTVSGYVGRGRVVGEAILQWAYEYAELSRADWELFRRHRNVDGS